MNEQQAIKIIKEEKSWESDNRKLEAFNAAITALELMHELNERNLTLEHLENYMKFEDECVKKGFTFKSLLEAREKQIPIPLVEKVHPDFPHMGKLFYCGCGTAYFEKCNKYCAVCGQRLEDRDEESI